MSDENPLLLRGAMIYLIPYADAPAFARKAVSDASLITAFQNEDLEYGGTVLLDDCWYYRIEDRQPNPHRTLPDLFRPFYAHSEAPGWAWVRKDSTTLDPHPRLYGKFLFTVTGALRSVNDPDIYTHYNVFIRPPVLNDVWVVYEFPADVFFFALQEVASTTSPYMHPVTFTGLPHLPIRDAVIRKHEAMFHQAVRCIQWVEKEY